MARCQAIPRLVEQLADEGRDGTNGFLAPVPRSIGRKMRLNLLPEIGCDDPRMLAIINFGDIILDVPTRKP